MQYIQIANKNSVENVDRWEIVDSLFRQNKRKSFETGILWFLKIDSWKLKHFYKHWEILFCDWIHQISKILKIEISSFTAITWNLPYDFLSPFYRTSKWIKRILRFNCFHVFLPAKILKMIIKWQFFLDAKKKKTKQPAATSIIKLLFRARC